MFQPHLLIAKRNLTHATLNDVDIVDVLLHKVHGPYFIWQISLVTSRRHSAKRVAVGWVGNV